MNHCKTCKHHRDGLPPAPPACLHPDLMALAPNPGDLRRSTGWCGPEGLYHEGKADLLGALDKPEVT